MTIIEGVAADTGELIELTPRGISLPGHATPVGLLLPEDISFIEWRNVGETLKSVEGSILWWVGDWSRFGERKYGETYAQAIDASELAYSTIRDAAWVSGRFELSRRRDNLSWSHHREVAALDSSAADRLLDLSEQEGWSRAELRKRVNQAKVTARLIEGETPGETCSVADLYRLVEIGHQFGTVYADPPWKYDNQGTRAATENHYDGMSVDELCALPVADLVAPNAHLHLWTTNAFIFECPRIFAAWGFEFRSSFVWTKPQMGIGNYWRNSHEFLLTAIRGDAKRFNDRSLMSWGQFDRTAHSAKPEEIRTMIERASAGPYLELFGRRTAPRWTVWGNQIERTMFDASTKTIE